MPIQIGCFDGAVLRVLTAARRAGRLGDTFARQMRCSKMQTRARFLTLAGAGITAAALPIATGAQGTKLRMAALYIDPFAQAFYTKESGTLARLGFDVEVTTLSNAAAIAAAIGGGSLELGIGDLISGVNAINAGVPITLLAGSALYISSEGASIIAVSKDSPMRTPHDLTGKTIAIPTLVGLTTACLRAWLPMNGVDVASVKLVELNSAAMVAAIQRGTVDAAVLGEPFITLSRNDVRNFGQPLDAIGKEYLLSVWYASKAWVEQDRDRARRVQSGIYEAARWANTHRSETFALLVRDAKVDGDKLRNMIRSTFATSLTPALIQPVLNMGTQSKIFDRQIDASTLIARL
jgi:NitT/TauT family transport system substrate-binding protein